MYNTFRWNWTTIAALVCPRPLLFANSDNDGIFPMSANERVSNRLESLYAHYGASDKMETVVSVGGHAYRADLRRAIFEFFQRTLKGDASPVTDPEMGLAAKIPGPDLRAFPGDLPADQLNTKIDETFVPLGRPGLPEEGKFEAWRDALVAELRRVSFAGVTPASTGSAGTLAVVPFGMSTLWDGAPGDASLVPLRGGWTSKNPPNTIEREYPLLGATADSDRVAVLLARGAAERYVGRGESGIIGAYAALLSGKGDVVLIDPPASHREGPHFLNVMRVLDIPEALGCLAPRKLTLIGAKDPAFDRTVEIYRRAGAADRIERR
jgi:hypothetical protein